MTGRRLRVPLLLAGIGLAVVGGLAIWPQLRGGSPAGTGQPEAGQARSREQQQQDVARALEISGAAVERNPEDFKARMDYAAALGQSRKYGEAMDQLRAAGRLDPKSAEPHLAMSDIFDVAYMLDMSLAAARAAVDVDPDSVRALTRLGQVTIGLDWNLAASRLMADAVRRFPKESSLWVVYALVKYQMNDYRGALDAISTAQRIDPANRALDGTLIDVHLKMGNAKAALDAAEAAQQSQPGSSMPALGKAKALRALRRFDEAEQVAASLLAVDPDNQAARYERALAMAGLGRHAEVVGLLEPLVKENPQYERASVNLADAYARLGRREDATRVNRKFQELERRSEAVVRALMAVGNQPDNPDAHLAAGRAHRAQGRMPRAVVEFAEAMRLRPGDPVARKELADALDAMQRTGEASAVRGTATVQERKQP